MKTLKLSGAFRRANDSLVEVVSARETVVLKPAAKAALAVTAGIDENGGSSTDSFLGDLDETVHGKSSARAVRSKTSAETEDERAFTDAAAHFVSAEWHVEK